MTDKNNLSEVNQENEIDQAGVQPESEGSRSDSQPDEMQESINRLRETSAKIEAENPRRPFTVRDIISDIIFFFVTGAVVFAWVLIMLLIVSFVTLSYLHFEFKKMLIVSGVAAGIGCIVYAVRKVRKYRAL